MCFRFLGCLDAWLCCGLNRLLFCGLLFGVCGFCYCLVSLASLRDGVFMCFGNLGDFGVIKWFAVRFSLLIFGCVLFVSTLRWTVIFVSCGLGNAERTFGAI